MRVLIAAAIFGISCGMYGCSNEANVAGRPMAAAGAPAASPGDTIQTTADAPHLAVWIGQMAALSAVTASVVNQP